MYNENQPQPNDDRIVALTMAQASTPSLFDRTVAQLRDVWRDLSLRAWPGGGGNGFRPNLPDDDAARLRQRIAECVASRGGEVSARARAAEIGRAYVSLAPDGRRRFLAILAKDFAAERDAVLERLFQETADGGVRRVGAHDDLRLALDKLDRGFLNRFRKQDGIQDMNLWSKGEVLRCA